MGLFDDIVNGAPSKNTTKKGTFDDIVKGDFKQETGFKTKSLAELLSAYGEPNTLNAGAKIVDGLPGVLEVGARRGYAGIVKVEQGALSILGDLLGSKSLSDASEVVGNRARQIENSAVLRGQKQIGFAPDSIANDVPEAGANAVSSVIQTAPSLIAGALAPGAALPALYANTFSQEYAQGKDSGLTGGKAALRALPMAAFEVAGEKLGGFDRLAEGLRAATRGNGVADLGTAMVSSALKEIPSEEFTTTGQFLTDKVPGIGLNQDATLADYGQQVKDTALTTALQSGAMGAAGRIIQGRNLQAPSVMDNIQPQPAPQTQAAPQINTPAIVDAISQAVSNVKPSAAEFLDSDTSEGPNVSQPTQQQPAGLDSRAVESQSDNAIGSPAIELPGPVANAGGDSAASNGAMPASDIPDGAAPSEPVASVEQQSDNPLQLPIEFESEAKNSPAYNQISLPEDVKSMADQFSADEVNNLLSEAGYVEPRQSEIKSASSASQIENTQPQSAASGIADDQGRQAGQTARAESTTPDEITGTPGSNEREGARQHVEAIVRRRAAANQLGKLKPFDNALKLAKDFMAGEPVSPAKFKNAATMFANDKPLADAFTALQELAKSPAKESRQNTRSAVDIFTEQINNAKTVDELKSIARNIQMETGVLNDAMAQQLDDMVMDRIDAIENSGDLLGDNTEKQQAVADAERAKDEKRNAGNDNASDFVLTGSDRPVDQAAARGTQDLFGQPESVQQEDQRPATTEQAAAEEVTQTDELKDTSDVGGELGFNKRNKFIRKQDILNASNDTERVQLAVKSKLWPKPDYQQLVDDGVNPVIAHVVKQVYDSLSTKPAFKGEQMLYDYVDAVESARDAVNEILADKKLMDGMIVSIGVQASKRSSVMSGNRTAELAEFAKLGEAFNGNDPLNYILDKVFPKNAQGSRWGRQNADGNNKANATGNKFYKAVQINLNTFIDALKAVEDGFPAKKEQWQISYRIEPKDGKFELIKKGRYSPTSTHDTEEQAIEAAKELTKRNKDADFEEPETLVQEGMRNGKPIRTGNVSSDELKNTIGLRAVNFGNWMSKSANAKERQMHVNAAFDAFHDLADILNLPIKAMALEGKLGLAIGAQGTGRYAAHFVPGFNEINLTRTKGAGSLAHEWAHALDHYFGVQAGMGSDNEPFASWLGKLPTTKTDGAEIRPEIAQAFKTIYETMKSKVEDAESARERHKKTYEGSKERLEKHINEFNYSFGTSYSTIKEAVNGDSEAENALKEILNGNAGKSIKYGKGSYKIGRTKFDETLYENVATVAKKLGWSYKDARDLQSLAGSFEYSKELYNKEPEQRQIHTDFYRNASVLDSNKTKNYWATPHELFARAFEMYVADKLAEKSNENRYLVSAWKLAESAGVDDPILKAIIEQADKRYPRGDERKAINKAFETLISEIKTKEDDAGNIALFKRDPMLDAIANIKRQQNQVVDQVQAYVDTIAEGWKNAPTIQVVYDMNDERIPEAVRRENDRQLSQGATGQPQGFITRGDVYIVASEMSGESDVLRTLFHESLGHYGLRGLYDRPALNAALDRVATMRAADVAKKAKQYGLNINNARDRLIAAEEVLAEMAETKPEIGVVKQVIAAIRKWLRENVPYFKNLELSDAEIIRDYILPARRYVETGGKEQSASDVVAAFQRSNSNTDITEDQLKRSMLRDELGRWKAPTSELISKADSKIKVPFTDKRFSEISKILIDSIAFGQAPKELRTMTRLYKADIQKAMEAASNVVKTMAPMSQLDRALVSDVVEKMVQAGVTPPEHIVNIATGMQNAMDIQTDELVKLGMLSQDSADRWRGRYLPRFYMRENTEGVKAWVGKMLRNSLPVRGIGGNSLKGRGLFEEVNVNEVPKYESLGWEVRDPLWKKNRQGELELVDANKAVTPEKVVVWRDWTPSERAEMGENRDALFRFVMGYTSMQNDIALGRLFDSIAKNQEWTRARASDGFVKVPDSEIPDTGGVKRYGNLSGLYVKKEILDHISQYEEASELWKYYRKALSFWKAGKALALDTPIPTLSGWSTMGEIKTGDTVFDEHGKPCKVTFATGVQLDRECYEVEFSDGTKIIADAEHLWFTIYHGKGSVKNTKLIMDTLKERTRGDNNHSIPVAGSLQTPDADLPIPPYALGAWLGDGHSYSAAICAGAKDADETAANVRAAGLAVGAYSIDKRNGVVTFCIRYTDSSLKRCDGLQPVMRRMNLLRNKHIPAIYLRASEAQRRDLLCGLMDTDGYITENGKCEFSTTSPQVRDGMMELLRSLGYKPVCGSYTARLKGRDCGDSWRIMFQAYGDRPVFKMARKLDRMRDCPKTRQRSGTRQIVAIRPVPSVPVKCIQVDSESRLYLAGDGMVPTHNTVLNPVSHVNNVVSNLTMAHFAGVSYWDVPKYIRAIKDLVNNSPMVQEAKDRGLMTGDITRAELMSDMPDDIKEMMQMQESAIKRKASTVFNIVTFGLSKPMSKAYRFEDDFFKYLIYRDARKNGLSPDDAVDYATRYIFTYDDLPKGARTVRDLAIPFFAYTYKAVPALTHTLFNYPWRFAAPAAAVWGVNAIAYALAAGDDGDDWQTMYEKGKELEAEERDNLPPWMQGRSALGAQKSIRLGTDEKTQLPVYMDVSRMIPGGDIFDVTNQADGVPVPAPIMPSNPVLTTIAAMFWNKDTFTGKEVTDLNDTGKEAAQKRAEWLLKQLSPAIAPTGYHADRLAEAVAQMSGDTIETPWKDYTGYGKDGLAVQEKYAIEQTFGIKARPIDLEKSAEIAQSKDNKEIRSNIAEIRQADRLLDQNAISQREYDRRVSDAEEKINAIENK